MDAIRSDLELVRARLDAFLKSAEPRADDWVILSHVAEQDGRAIEGVQNKIVMALARITPNEAHRNARAAATSTPSAPVDLLVVFMANFEGRNYAEGLGAISRTISFFHRTPLFTRGNGGNAGTFSMVMTSFGLEDLTALMTMLGTTYRPCVFYTLRGVPIA